jgi:hypothetical protein
MEDGRMMRWLSTSLLTLSMVCSACCQTYKDDPTMLQPPLKPGQVLDPDSLYAKTWPGKPSLARLKDNLILATPPQFHAFWRQKHWITGLDMVPRPPMALDKIPVLDSAGFVMHMPDFGGYTPDNYQKEFDEDVVLVFEIRPASMSEMEPDAPGGYPPNGFKRISTGEHPMVDLNRYRDLHGLRCYTSTDADLDEEICYGRRDSSLEEYLILDITVPPYSSITRFPQMQTTYFSPKYGGLRIGWRSHMKNFPRWREIDAQVWKYIDAWNIAPRAAQAQQPTQPATR